MDIPPVQIVECVEQAAAHYNADASKVLATIKAKNGRHSEIRIRPDGEVEIGLAAIPAKEVPGLAGFGITAERLTQDACLNVSIATYLYQRDLQQKLPHAGPVPASAPTKVTTRRSRAGNGPPGRCMVSAAARYHIPLPIMQAVIKTEGGWDGLKKPNSNGSFDLGRAQINTIHLPELRKYGITEAQLANDPCTNLHVAAYRLRFEVNRVKDFWRGVGNYHSRTPHLNKAYQARVRKNLAAIIGDDA